MRPIWHVAASAGVAAGVYQVTRNWSMAAIVAATGILIDLDHALEHVFRSRQPFCLKTFWDRYNTYEWPYIVLVFHAYELIALLAVWAWFSKIASLWMIVLGMSVHMLLDEVGNRLPWASGGIAPGFYFITYRWCKGFRSPVLNWRKDPIQNGGAL